MSLSLEDFSRRDKTGNWQCKTLVLSDHNMVRHSLICEYFEKTMKGIFDVETQLRYMMESSKHWCNANKQFRGGL